MSKAILIPGKEKRVWSRHPWIFRSDIEKVEGEFEPGDVVDILSSRGRFLARGFYNPASQISLRVMTYREEPVDRSFIFRRVHEAVAYRRTFADLQSCLSGILIIFLKIGVLLQCALRAISTVADPQEHKVNAVCLHLIPVHGSVVFGNINSGAVGVGAGIGVDHSSVFQYKCDRFYDPSAEGAIAWDDPDLGIDWKIPAGEVILSGKDRQHLRLKDIPAEDLFEYGKDLYE